jgi:heme/copper-type cytochrome/quinol oxidase subunit 2
MIRSLVAVFSLTMAGLLLLPEAVLACPSCYGAADSPMIDGMNTAIMSMVGIVAFVLCGFVAFFLFMRSRMKKLNEQKSSETYVNNKGVVQWNNF